MDEYLEHLKGLLKIDSDKIFQETIIEATNKVNEFRLVAKGVTATAADELIRYQAACDEVFTKLKNYMENEPNLQHFLNTPELSDMISFFRLNKGNIINLAKEKPAKKEENKEESAPQEEAQEIKTDSVQTKVSTFYIPGNDRIIVPMNGQVILPGTVNRKVLRAFDRTIPFEVRLKEILDKKAKLEKKGVKFHELTEEIIRDVMEGDWLYLWGPSGCGKSYVIQQVADLIGIDVVENQKISRDYSVLGYNDPHGRFRATQTFAAALYGRMIFYDEFDSDNVIAQVVLNPLYSKLKNVIANPSKEQFYQFGEDMNISINPNMRMISAGNTSGNVIESEVWNARGKIDESLLQRLTPKKLYYDDKLERSLFGNNDGWYKLFVKFRKICDAYANEETDEEDMPQGVLTTRDAQDIATYIQNNSKSVDQIMREKFVQIKDNNYLDYIVAHLPKYTITEREMEQSERALKEYDENALTKRLIYACNRAKNGIR
jgi:energy-coupling factor transporter ATP-binding protein EcfA2